MGAQELESEMRNLMFRVSRMPHGLQYCCQTRFRFISGILLWSVQREEACLS